jgi:galactonate dehydratase
MKITDVKTFLCAAAHPQSGEEGVTSAHWNSRNWCFVKIHTDSGIYGVGESSGWPRVIETAIHDLTPLLIGEDPMLIERLWHKMLTAMMGHGMLGVVGHGALTGIEVHMGLLKH